MANREVDVLIIGGGLTGAALMLALRGSGYQTLLVDKQPLAVKISPDFDARTLALSVASTRILSMLGVWEELEKEVCPIHHIHVSEQRRFGSTRLQAGGKNPHGFVIEMQYLQHALSKKLETQNLLAPAELTALDRKTGTATIDHLGQSISIRAALIVAADGADSRARELCQLPKREKKYDHQALVANIGLSRPHEHWAYERFTPSGPLALLPMSANRAALVWSLPPALAGELRDAPEQEFLRQLQHAFGYRLGRFIKAGNRNCYPLRQVIMPIQHAWPLVFIGNAAHTLHPVAGQGFNLGLRDVALLAQYILERGLNEAMLHSYQKARHFDQTAITHFTDGLVGLFSFNNPALGLIRGAGLLALDNFPAMQRLLRRLASGFTGVVPDLACKIPFVRQNSNMR
ncbi:FAD-dependent monooxygenase [Legionella londiniensis]|uniref:2-octaprenyl-6-methoxyphenol hydroxylase n=1 Tax=Legionella londiniensis TaxID=45068 RepID=A0A0W0VNP4_9GAMM|nr:FAD-dependent monooxygenase [Legionella londiniensis]KTD21787.1 2-octaprenyl-6-methoxyphenol hydroxylase [Legionella londiniensis]STX92163.1 2-octaprenyl-6-methoxyphenol hydroxylase [Legionella londiniensis]